MRSVMGYWLVGLVVLGLSLGGCGSDPKATDEYQGLQDQLVATQQQLADDTANHAAEIEDLRDQLDAAETQLADSAGADSELPAIVAEFKAAYESGDLEQVRALYTEDGIFATTDDVHRLYFGDEALLGTWGLDGSEFIRTATLHHGEMSVTDAVQVGDRAVAFAWAWEDFASGTAVLHLRDGRIVVASLAVTEFDIPPAEIP